MKLKLISALTFFLMLCVPSFCGSFYDDYQAYDSTTNPAFISNYSTTGSTWSIESAESVYLKHYVGTGQYYANIFPNATRINGSLPVSVSFDLRNNSKFPIGSAFSIVYNYNSGAGSGYAVNFRFYQTALNQTNTTIDLRRCSSGLTASHPSGWIYCGVSLATTQFLLDNSESYHYDDGDPYSYINNTLPVKITIDETGTANIYLNNTLRLTHNDRLYSTGAFFIGSYNYPVGAGFQDLRIDRLNISTELTLGDPSPYTTGGYTIYAWENGRYNKLSWYDKTETAFETSYNESTNVLNISHLITFSTFKVLKDGIPITYGETKNLNMSIWIQANTHSCANFFKPTNFSDSVYTALGFDPSDPTAIPIYSIPIFAFPMPDLTGYDEAGYNSTLADAVYYIYPYAPMVCTDPTLITNVVLIYDNDSNVYYTFKIYTGVGLTEAQIEAIVPDAEGETNLIPRGDINDYLIGADIETLTGTDTGPKDPYIVAERLFETDMIMIFVGLGIVGVLGAVGGFMVGGIGGVMWLMVMVIIGLIPMWIGLLFMGILALGVAVVIKSGFT